jgi:hypothetical protein
MNSKAQKQSESPVSDAGFESEAIQVGNPERNYCLVTSRDPEDVKTILRLTKATTVFALASVISSSMLFYQLTRPASVIIKERGPNGDVVVGTNLSSGQPEKIQLGLDRPGDGDKKHLATKVAELFFHIDPKTRTADIITALKTMTPEAAQALVAQAKQSGEWNLQTREEWQTVWTLQDVAIARDDNYQVHVIGLQEIRSTVNSAPQRRKRQLVFTLLLKADPAGRTYDNQNTGYRVAGITEMKILDQALEGAEAKVLSPIAVAETQPKN